MPSGARRHSDPAERCPTAHLTAELSPCRPAPGPFHMVPSREHADARRETGWGRREEHRDTRTTAAVVECPGGPSGVAPPRPRGRSPGARAWCAPWCSRRCSPSSMGPHLLPGGPSAAHQPSERLRLSRRPYATHQLPHQPQRATGGSPTTPSTRRSRSGCQGPLPPRARGVWSRGLTRCRATSGRNQSRAQSTDSARPSTSGPAHAGRPLLMRRAVQTVSTAGTGGSGTARSNELSTAPPTACQTASRHLPSARHPSAMRWW